MYNLARLLKLMLIFTITGCTTYSQVNNLALPKNPTASYTIVNGMDAKNRDDIIIMLAFSGGGARASAFSYGVLQALNIYKLEATATSNTLLDEVDIISSVSGGSFTAAYYGLYGKEIFNLFESEFLYKNVDKDLIDIILSPIRLFSDRGRTTEAIHYYQKQLFKGATFANIKRDGPLIVINATDIGGGVRFSFLQEYFDLLCSDLNSYPIANAVTASSAVPIVFNPVVLENMAGCSTKSGFNLQETSENRQIRTLINGLNSYKNKKQRKYIHLVDGGITDNLGLLALYDIVEANGNARAYFENFILKAQSTDKKRQAKFLVITVDASTYPDINMDKTLQVPEVKETVGAITDIQLHRYNDATKQLMRRKIKEWALFFNKKHMGEMKTYFVDLNLQDLTVPKNYKEINNIPTALSLKPKYIKILIDEGKNQLSQHTVFKEFLSDLNK